MYVDGNMFSLLVGVATLVVACGEDVAQTLRIPSMAPVEHGEVMERSRRAIALAPQQGVIAHRSGSVVGTGTVDDRGQILSEQPPPQPDGVHPHHAQVEHKMFTSVVRRSVTVDDRAQVALERRPSHPDDVHPDRLQVERNAVASVVRSVMLDDGAHMPVKHLPPQLDDIHQNRSLVERKQIASGTQLPLGKLPRQTDGVYPGYSQVEHKAVASEGDVSLSVQPLLQHRSRPADLVSGKSLSTRLFPSELTLGLFLACCIVSFCLGVGAASRGRTADDDEFGSTDGEEDCGRSKSKSTGEFCIGDNVKIIKEESTFEGQAAVVTEFYGSPARIRVRMQNGSMKSYFFEELTKAD